MHLIVCKGRQISCQLQDSCRTHGMPNDAFGIVNISIRAILEKGAYGVAFFNIALLCTCCMGVDNMDVLWRQSGPFYGQLHAFSLSRPIGQHKIPGIRIHGITDKLAVDAHISGKGLIESFQYKNTCALRNHDAIAPDIKGPACLCGVMMHGKGAFCLKTCKNPERPGAFRDASGKSHVDFAEFKHLRSLNQSSITGCTGSADGVMRTGYAKVHGDFTGRVVQYRAWIMVMTPEVGIKCKLA